MPDGSVGAESGGEAGPRVLAEAPDTEPGPAAVVSEAAT